MQLIRPAGVNLAPAISVLINPIVNLHQHRVVIPEPRSVRFETFCSLHVRKRSQENSQMLKPI
jgi:hypothetical protein